MTLDYYRIFYYVARYKSFSKAAQILGNNQPNITRYINLLEHELGCNLCVRTHKGISLTPEGQLLYEHVEAAMYQLKNAQDALKKNQSLESGTITIGVSDTALRLYLSDKLETFLSLSSPHSAPKESESTIPVELSRLTPPTANLSA